MSTEASSAVVSSRSLRETLKSEITGARVLRPISIGDEIIKAGTKLSNEQCRKMRNLDALRRQGRIHIYSSTGSPQPTGETSRFAIHRGCGKYDVVEGVMIATTITKEEADAMAASTASATN